LKQQINVYVVVVFKPPLPVKV